MFMNFVQKRDMLLPIAKFGAPILRHRGIPVDLEDPGLQNLIENMWETMYHVNGCGLAAPQVNKSIRLFVVDSMPTYMQMEDAERNIVFDGDQGIKEVFINPVITSRSERIWWDEEGCLSIPGITLRISRSWSVSIRYFDDQLHERTRTFLGITARMIQHEYDHIEGKLFLDYLDAGRRLLLKNRFDRINRDDASGS
ncbi:peptide deformylase [Dyadobacter soli]|uniref:Peptide deformylase n=1 Tax=Dyadobacter soli TaxID=659014 RepID=A0A1G6VXG5_9BACT|nr:peptide deformylase [Dyadobacter soli]SDD58410.1 peptide deformylase [Dyadobacter soli]